MSIGMNQRAIGGGGGGGGRLECDDEALKADGKALEGDVDVLKGEGSAVKELSKALKDDRVAIKCDEGALKYFFDIPLCREYMTISVVDIKNDKSCRKLCQLIV